MTTNWPHVNVRFSFVLHNKRERLVFICLAVETHDEPLIPQIQSKSISLSAPKGTPLSPPSLPLPRSSPSLSPSLRVSASGGEKMEHGNYGNCIRQVLGGSSPQKHLKRWEEYVSSLQSDKVSSSVTGPMMQSVGRFHALCLILAAARQSAELHLKAKRKGKQREGLCVKLQCDSLATTPHTQPPSAPLQ